MELFDLFPKEACKAVANMNFKFVVGGVRVSALDRCPIGELLAHPSVWDKVPKHRRADWKPIMDHPSTVAWFASDLGAGPDIEADWPSADVYAAALEAWLDEATNFIQEICDGWDSGKLTQKNLKKLLGAGK